MGLSTAPAHAIDNSGKYSTTYVDGAGSLTDDFGDHFRELGGSLCNGCAKSWNTDTVIMWQSILVAEGLLNHSAIDGKFGSGTSSATKAWQRRYSLTADGKVGPATWGKADQRLKWSNGSVRYVGRRGYVSFYRGGSGWGGYDEGAYQLTGVSAQGGYTGFHGGRIHHNKRTIDIN